MDGLPVTSCRKYTKKRSFDSVAVWVCEGACMFVLYKKSEHWNQIRCRCYSCKSITVTVVQLAVVRFGNESQSRQWWGGTF